MNEQFLRNEMLWGREGQQRLTAAHVIVFGLGGVGSYAAECLARSGVGELTLVDSDTISVTNLNRQLEALWSTVGQPKAAAAAARIRDIHPEAVLHPIHAVYDAAHREDFFPAGCRYDYIVDAIDLVSCKLDLAETARRLNIPLIMALGTGNKLDPTLLRAADISETYGCPLARVMRKELRNRGILHQRVVFSPEQAAPSRQLEAPPPGRRSVPASNPWLPAAAGLLLGSVVVRDILNQKERESIC
ncbi:tRNA threonylcarbamoyladenosine dehydratase [Oscillospiraceae bacterium 50-60]